MSRLSKDKRDNWARHRAVLFAANKNLADKLAKQQGGKCLSGPQRKNDLWLWQCKDAKHKPWKANFFQVAGTGNRKGSWCRGCSISEQAKKRKSLLVKNKQLADKLAKIKGGRCLSGPGLKQDMWRWKCSNPEHKYWQATLCQIQGSGKKLGSWCPRCVGRNVPKKELAAWAKRFGGKLVKQASSTVKSSIWSCKYHDEFSRTYNNMKATGSFCPLCSASLGERKCKAAMEQLFGTKFVKRRFSDLKGLGGKSLEIDLYNDELKLGLEHQGEQHFIRKKYFGENKYDILREHDKRKKDYCSKQGITLIEIRQVGEKTPDGKLKEAIRDQLLNKGFPLPSNFDEINLSLDIAALPTLQEDKWEEIKTEAYRREWTIISKRYLGCMTIHRFICKNGHPVEIRPSYFLWGDGCWRCEQRPVVAENGLLFDSITEAAKSLERTISSVSSGIRKHGRVRGHRLATINHRRLAALRGMSGVDQKAAVAAIFAKLPQRPKVGQAGAKPVVLEDGRLFTSAYEAARALNADEKVSIAASKRPAGKIKGIRIARISKDQLDAFILNPSLIDKFWKDRPQKLRKLIEPSGDSPTH
jgi:hypothetical protein